MNLKHKLLVTALPLAFCLSGIVHADSNASCSLPPYPSPSASAGWRMP